MVAASNLHDTLPDSYGPTLVAGAASEADVSALVGGRLPAEDRYVGEEQLGEGGMGEVRLCHDRNIGRHVAMKIVRQELAARGDLRVRFVREARVQGQLEHPSVVPVYDIGVAPSGALYFTMKRVHGTTMETVLERLREGDVDACAVYSRRRLLTAFGQVCLAIDFAHSRGVLHRDLKPSNVMLGNFGEVYVLDWGIAKIGAAGEEAGPESLVDSSEVPCAATACGAVMGTPGYMAPEQRDGEIGKLDARTDVYALGVILAELLEGDPEADAPVELLDVVACATAHDPDRRLHSARVLHEAVERYLEGDRDVERRLQLAADHARMAGIRAARAFGGGAEAEFERRCALCEVSRALALDPKNASALETFVTLLTRPPHEVPEEARAEMLADAIAAQRSRLRAASVSAIAWGVLAALSLLNGVESAALAVAFVGSWAAAAVACFVGACRPHPQGKLAVPIVAAVTLATAITSLAFGPFIFVPALAMFNVVAFLLNPDRTRRSLAALAGLAAMVLPLALEWVGLLSPSYRFVNGALQILPRLLAFSGAGSIATIVVGNLAILALAFGMMTRFRDVSSDVERRMYLHTWQLRQLAPPDLSPGKSSRA